MITCAPVAARFRPEKDFGVDPPETHYAKTVDGVHIAYQVVGDGPVDLVFVTWLLNVEKAWSWARTARTFRRMATFSRLILLDRRGTGMSDHAIDKNQAFSLEVRMDDIRAVMDAAGSERAVLFGVEEGFALAAIFAATYPQRTVGLVSYGAAARNLWAPDYPWGAPEEEYDADAAAVERNWGTKALARDWATFVFPEDVDDEETITEFASFMRSGGGPGDAVSWFAVDRDMDVRDVLPTVRVPTLVIHRTDDRAYSIENGRYIARHIPGATLAELPGSQHAWSGHDDLLDEVETFVSKLRREEAEFDRVLASILFTDIVGATKTVAELGDYDWKMLVERHHAVVRGLLTRYRGTEVDTAGDGFFATFDGPARAVRCATAIVAQVGALGMAVRTGVHTGEVETIAGKVGGLAVNIASRVGALAGPSEVLVSQTVKDLVAGSGLTFEDRGEHELKGIPDHWHLYGVVSESP
jgi:class 3 adenylate cyclase